MLVWKLSERHHPVIKHIWQRREPGVPAVADGTPRTRIIIMAHLEPRFSVVPGVIIGWVLKVLGPTLNLNPQVESKPTTYRATMHGIANFLISVLLSWHIAAWAALGFRPVRSSA